MRVLKAACKLLIHVVYLSIDDEELEMIPGGFGDRGIEGKILSSAYARENKTPYWGICLGMQTLFESSDEHEEGADAIPGLGVIPGKVIKFDETKMDVPHIGWNGRVPHKESPVLKYISEKESAYFVHSYYAPITEENKEWVLTSTTYSGQSFVSSVQRGSVVATQFHPEKSHDNGVRILKNWIFCKYFKGNNRKLYKNGPK